MSPARLKDVEHAISRPNLAYPDRCCGATLAPRYPIQYNIGDSMAHHCSTGSLTRLLFGLDPADRASTGPTPQDKLPSPEVLPDKRVTFPIFAPQASAVTIDSEE